METGWTAGEPGERGGGGRGARGSSFCWKDVCGDLWEILILFDCATLLPARFEHLRPRLCVCMCVFVSVSK
jgi:hypothetical protein